MNPFRAQRPPSRTSTHQPAQQHSTHLLDGSLVNTAALVDKMSGGGGLSRVDVADNDAIQSAQEGSGSRGRQGTAREGEAYTFTCVFSLPIVVEYAGDYADG